MSVLLIVVIMFVSFSWISISFLTRIQIMGLTLDSIAIFGLLGLIRQHDLLLDGMLQSGVPNALWNVQLFGYFFAIVLWTMLIKFPICYFPYSIKVVRHLFAYGRKDRGHP